MRHIAAIRPAADVRHHLDAMSLQELEKNLLRVIAVADGVNGYGFHGGGRIQNAFNPLTPTPQGERGNEEIFRAVCPPLRNILLCRQKRYFCCYQGIISSDYAEYNIWQCTISILTEN